MKMLFGNLLILVQKLFYLFLKYLYFIDEKGKVKLTIRKPTRKLTFEIPYDSSIAEIEAGWKEKNVSDQIEAEKYFASKLERFLNRYVKIYY